jgi:electron transfer flavoprotein beta subunit
LGVAVASRTQVLKMESPPPRKAGLRVKTVDELLEKLKNDAKVL